MSNELEAARQQAREDYRTNPQTQMASEQTINNAELRDNYNAEILRQRQIDEERGIRADSR